MAVLQDRFCRNVDAILRQARISRAELARRMGVTQTYPLNYINKSVSPGFDVVERFATALGLPDPNLLTHEDLEHVLKVAQEHVQSGRTVAVAG